MGTRTFFTVFRWRMKITVWYRSNVMDDGARDAVRPWRRGCADQLTAVLRAPERRSAPPRTRRSDHSERWTDGSSGEPAGSLAATSSSFARSSSRHCTDTHIIVIILRTYGRHFVNEQNNACKYTVVVQNVQVCVNPTYCKKFFMVAQWNRAGHYIFALWFLSSFFFSIYLFFSLISAVGLGDWMSTILPHMVRP